MQTTRQTFMPALCEEMVKFLTDYYDNVREQAQAIVFFIVKSFIPKSFSLSKGQEESLHMLKANAIVGWGEAMRT